jgi:hypothetical protein
MLKFHCVRSINVADEELFRTMGKHLTAIKLINDEYIRIVMSLFEPSDFMSIHSLTLFRVRIHKGKKSYLC